MGNLQFCSMKTSDQSSTSQSPAKTLRRPARTQWHGMSGNRCLRRGDLFVNRMKPKEVADPHDKVFLQSIWANLKSLSSSSCTSVDLGRRVELRERTVFESSEERFQKAVKTKTKAFASKRVDDCLANVEKRQASPSLLASIR
ncbi:dnaJ homolog subfamily C member 24 isoform X15 [Danio rerio]|uniref:DnaJ homolog subfamily C member 24 isoform X15 n=1 Tax=Danio rerio TaxID=7955 RepID=A0AC58IUV7_DANRE